MSTNYFHLLNSYEITLTHPLPFEPSNGQAIYIEREYDEEVNAFILDWYDWIRHQFNTTSIDFCYIPYRVEEEGLGIAKYHNPCWKNEVKKDCYTTKEFVSELFNGNVPSTLKPSIAIYLKYHSSPGNEKFKIVEFPSVKMKWWEKLLKLVGHPYFNKDLYWTIGRILNTSLLDPNDTALYCRAWYKVVHYEQVSQDEEDLYEEIDRKIRMLKERGVDSLILKKILSEMVDEYRPVSRLLITKDLKIILPDYDNMEVRMEPINKAVFLLFLKHEEGIVLKELSDHKDELKSLYTRLSHNDKKVREDSLETLLDPTKNSINEKISRIREAFIAKFEEDLASNYIITGKRGEPKRITLDRSLVTWE